MTRMEEMMRLYPGRGRDVGRGRRHRDFTSGRPRNSGAQKSKLFTVVFINPALSAPAEHIFMNAEMKELRKELLHGRARHVLVPLGFGGGWTRSVQCRRWRAAPIIPATPTDEPLLWHERLAKLANRAALR